MGRRQGPIGGQAKLLVKLASCLLVGLEDLVRDPGHRRGRLAGHDDHAIAVGDDHVARADEHPAAGDRPIDRLDLVAAGPDAAPRGR